MSRKFTNKRASNRILSKRLSTNQCSRKGFRPVCVFLITRLRFPRELQRPIKSAHHPGRSRLVLKRVWVDDVQLWTHDLQSCFRFATTNGHTSSLVASTECSGGVRHAVNFQMKKLRSKKNKIKPKGRQVVRREKYSIIWTIFLCFQKQTCHPKTTNRPSFERISPPQAKAECVTGLLVHWNFFYFNSGNCLGIK